MLKVLSILFCILSFACFANEYKVSLLSLEPIMNAECSVTAINDKGQVLGGYYDLNSNKNKIYVLDPKNGLNIIESKDQSIRPITINNAGQIIGYGSNSKAFIWSKALGIRWLDIANGSFISVNDLNDLGQIIGTYQRTGLNETRRPFIWDYGVVTDMGPGSDFAQAIEALGYHVMNVEILSINNKGEMAGYFGYGKFNEKKKKYVFIGYESFFWDGEIQVLPLPIALNQEPQAIKVNSQSYVMISTNYIFTYLWDALNGIKTIENFTGYSLNDSNILLGTTIVTHKDDLTMTPAIYKGDNIISIEKLLGIEDISHMASYCSDNYAIERLSNFSNINNKGQIPCMGSIWGDLYPCLLEPGKKQEISNAALETFMKSYNTSQEYDKGSFLTFAIRHKYQDLLAYLIKNTSETDNSNQSLFAAAETGNTDAISLMAEAGWNINCRKQPYGESLLHQAARFGHWDTCQELINLGLSCNDTSMHNKHSPLYLTTELANNAKSQIEKTNAFKVAFILLVNGADPNNGNDTGATPLTSICRGQYDYKLIELLIASGADPNLTLSNGASSISNVIASGYGNNKEKLKVIHKLLENGANPNYRCHIKYYGYFNELKNHNYSIPPIVAAICLNDSALVEMLIQYGADIINPVRATQFGTLYPLDYAIKWNRQEIIEILNKNGAKKSS